MSTNFSILITSVSGKIPLVHAVRASAHNLGISGDIVGGDSDGECVGKYFVDKFWHMPAIGVLSIDALIDYCKGNNIRAIIPTRDGELAFFAKYANELSDENINVMISSQTTIETCYDKLLFYQRLSTGVVPAIPTALTLSDVEGPRYVVKERFGAGSRFIGLNLDRSQAEAWASDLDKPIFQPFISGREYSVDVYVAKDGIAHGCVVRSRDRIVAGESQVTTSVAYPELEEHCARIAEKLGIYGHAVYQVMVESSGKAFLIECNPRFGGASTVSIACGLKSFEWFLLETLGRPLTKMNKRKQQYRQVRYSSDLILPLG